MKIPFLGLLPAIFIFLLTYCSSPVQQDKTLESQNNIELRPRPAAYILDSTEAFDLLHRCEIYAYLFNVDSALMLARECVNRFEDLLKYTQDSLTREYYADSYFNLGYLYQLKKHNDSAFLYLNKALDICRMYLGEDHLITTKCLIKIGNCYREYGDLIRAKEHYLKAYEIRVRTMDSLNTFLVNINSVMAAYYWNMGDFYNTEIFASREQSLIQRLYYHFVVQNPDIQDAVFYRQFMGTGNRPPVVRNLLLSNIPRMYINSTLDLTWRYLENGEGEKAAYYASLTDSLVRKHDPRNTFLLLSVLNSKANILLFNGELNEAEKLIRKIETWNHEAIHIAIRNNLSEFYSKIGKYQDCLRILEGGLVDSQKLSNYFLFKLMENKARALHDGGRLEECMAYCSGVLSNRLRLNLAELDDKTFSWEKFTGYEIMRIQGFLRPLIQSLIQAGLRKDEMNTLKEAYRLLHAFHASMAYLQDELYIRQSKTNRVQYLYPFYEDVIELCFSLYYKTGNEQYAHDVFFLSDLVKSFQIKEMQEQKNINAPGQEGKLRNKAEQLKFELSAVRDKLLELELNTPVKDSLKWFNLKRVQSELAGQLELYAADEHSRSWLPTNPYAKEIYPLGELQERLRVEKAELLDYFVGQKNLYILLLKGDGFKLYKQALDSARIHEMNLLTDNLASDKSGYGNEDLDSIATRLFDFLIMPVYGSMKTNNWIVVPDHWISRIPFEYLRTFRHDSSVMLLSDHTIRYEYSSTMALRNENKTEPALTYAGFAPKYNTDEIFIHRGLDSMITAPVFLANRDHLGALAYNEPEVRESAALWKGASFTGTRVAKTDFLQKGTKARILHLAMHALADNKQPEYSQLIFKTQEDSGSSESLYAYELARIRVQAELSVLSACNSGNGRYLKGEGVMSLARAFKAAGCPNIVMSLWQANDASTKEIVVEFFRKLKMGLGKADALREAKLEYLKKANPELKNPHYWAGLVLVGDNRPLQMEIGRSWAFLMIGILYIAALLLLAGLIHRTPSVE